ncbi:hypothetical protein FM112_05385 [Gulosibacter sp. 10]|nr:hypothetical protein FM112_05385 [Gulosibacter sp. 10]
MLRSLSIELHGTTLWRAPVVARRQASRAFSVYRLQAVCWLVDSAEVHIHFWVTIDKQKRRRFPSVDPHLRFGQSKQHAEFRSQRLAGCRNVREVPRRPKQRG